MNDEEQGNRVRVWVSSAAVALILGFLGFRIAGDMRVSREMDRSPEPPAWARTPTTNWPKLVLMQEARFKSHSELSGGCASLIRLPSGEIVALTAGHLLGKENGVKPGFLRGGLGGLDLEKLGTLDAEIVSWRLFSAERPQDGITVAGLFGGAREFDRDCDQVLLRLLSKGTNFPVTPLGIRTRPVEMGEQLWVVGYEKVAGEMRQTVRSARRMPGGLGFTCELLPPAEMDGWSGAPVLDQHGLLVAIVTGGTLMDVMSSSKPRGFSGHEITELNPVFKADIKKRIVGSKPKQTSA